MFKVFKPGTEVEVGPHVGHVIAVTIYPSDRVTYCVGIWKDGAYDETWYEAFQVDSKVEDRVDVRFR